MTLDIRIHNLSSGLAQVSYVDPVSRRRVRRKFKCVAEARNHQNQLQKEFASTGSTLYSQLPVGQLLKLYLESKPDCFMKRLGRPVFLSFTEKFASTPINEVSSVGLSDWLEAIKSERNLSPRSLPNIKTAYSQFFDFAIEKNALTKNPMVGISLDRGEATRARVILDEDEVPKLLAAIKDVAEDTVYPIVFLLAHTGARLGEILNLKWQQVNFELGTIHLLKTKNGDDRLIHASAHALKFLRWLPHDGEHVILHPDGSAWSEPRYRKQFTKIRRKIGFYKHWTNHSLRHSFAANYLKQGGDTEQLQQILGHKEIAMTVDLYGKINADDVQEPSPFDF